MSNKKSSKAPKRSKNQKSGSNEAQQLSVLRNFGTVNTRQHLLVRRMAGPEFTVSTTAGGVVASQSIGASNQAFSCPDFASAAGLYQLYRVRAIMVQLFPLWPVPVWNGVSITTAPAYVCVSPFYSNYGVVSLQGQLDATGLKIISGYKGGTFTTHYKGDPEAHFWTPVNVAVPTAESYGLVMQGTSTASTASIVVYRAISWYLVEFKMAS